MTDLVKTPLAESPDRLLDALWREVADIVLCLKTWEQLFVSDDKAQHDMIRRISGFAGLFQHVVSDYITLALARLLDPKGNFGLKRVIEAWDNPPGDARMTPARQLLDRFVRETNIVEQHRNRRIAHREVRSLLAPTQLPKLTLHDIRTAVDTLVQLYSAIAQRAERAPTNFEVWAGVLPSAELLGVLKSAETWRFLRLNSHAMEKDEIWRVVVSGELVVPQQNHKVAS